MELSPTTIKRDWAIAKAWLYERLSDAGSANQARAPNVLRAVRVASKARKPAPGFVPRSLA